MSQFATAVRGGINNEFIRWAEGFGQDIKFVSTSQIRNIFGSVKKMEMTGSLDRPALLMLKARLAYARARERKLAKLEQEITAAIDAVDEAKPDQETERFRRFCQGFEAILAYHKAAENSRR
jgi:CRISPR-associated protein Csm2